MMNGIVFALSLLCVCLASIIMQADCMLWRLTKTVFLLYHNPNVGNDFSFVSHQNHVQRKCWNSQIFGCSGLKLNMGLLVFAHQVHLGICQFCILWNSINVSKIDLLLYCCFWSSIGGFYSGQRNWGWSNLWHLLNHTLPDIYLVQVW